jgi:hypothetical protein
MTELGISHSDYYDDQKNSKRQSGTTKGKRAVRAFLKALDERFSDGAIGGDDWNSGLPGIRSTIANNYFWKWVMEVPPWGTPAFNAAMVTVVGLPMPGRIMPMCLSNCYGDSPSALRSQAVCYGFAARAAWRQSWKCWLRSFRMARETRINVRVDKKYAAQLDRRFLKTRARGAGHAR